MDHVVRVHEIASFKHLPDNLLRLQMVYALLTALSLNLVEDGPVELLKDEENAIVFAKHFHQVDNVIVLQLLQYADLTNCCLPHLSLTKPTD
jgi:hypothetical protein